MKKPLYKNIVFFGAVINMAISDLQIRQGKVDITAEVVDKGDVREFEKFGVKGRVCNCNIKDASGEITLAVWNDDIEKVNVGDKVHIINGYVGEWQGTPQLSTGKFGQLEVIDSDASTAEEKEEASVIAGEDSEKEQTADEVTTDDEKTEEEILDGGQSDEGEKILSSDEKTEEESLEEEKEDKESPENEETEDEKWEEATVEEEDVVNGEEKKE